MSCAEHQKPLPESICSLLVWFYSDTYPFQVKFNKYKIAEVSTYTCVFCTSSNEGIGLCFPDYENCCLAGEKGTWCTQTSLSFCSRMDSTGNLLWLKIFLESAELLLLHMFMALCWVFSCVLGFQGSNHGESGSISDMS